MSESTHPSTLPKRGTTSVRLEVYRKEVISCDELEYRNG